MVPVVIAAGCLVIPGVARAADYTFKVVASFSGANGLSPLAGLYADGQGNLFGTTQFGGANNDGVVYELLAGSSTPLALGSFDGTNGANPVSVLIADSHGNLFGTAPQGGANHDGTLFEVAAGSHAITTVASFNGANGAFPQSGLVADSHGNFYGTTENGGAHAQGNVFELPAGGSTPITLASFGGNSGPRIPQANLIVDGQGNLFGTTQLGGAANQGAVFELTAGSSTPTTLFEFNGTNGSFPQSGLIADGHGNLFGTASAGGTGANEGNGVVFELPSGSHTPMVLADFGDAVGNNPFGPVVADVHGNLLGTTTASGSGSDGTVFELSPGSTTPIVLENFNGTNGEFPESGLTADGHGNFFGTAPGGGMNNDGVIFELSPTAVPEPTWIVPLIIGAAGMAMRRR
jgi:uncharacterized repeat protein (TIGR03803 family)